MLLTPSQSPTVQRAQQALLARFPQAKIYSYEPVGPANAKLGAKLAFGSAADVVYGYRRARTILALDSDFAAAPGQRLLADAVREAKRARVDGSTQRLGIFGHGIAHSRSPRLHAQPFDRIDLPEDAPMGELLDALRPHYRGFAVTNPFK